jgi:serine/threonine-protein kinase
MRGFTGVASTAVAAGASHTGTALGPYTLERLLGQGGMGEVWLAQRTDGHYQGTVAVKLLHPYLTRPEMRLRFRREGQIVARLSHPHIARLFDAGASADGLLYINCTRLSN